MRATSFFGKKRNSATATNGLIIESPEQHEKVIIQNADKEMLKGLQINGKSILDLRKNDLKLTNMQKTILNSKIPEKFSHIVNTAPNSKAAIEFTRFIQLEMIKHLKEEDLSAKDKKMVESIINSHHDSKLMLKLFEDYQKSLASQERYLFSTDIDPYISLVNFLKRHLFSEVKDAKEKELLANSIANSFHATEHLHSAQNYLEKKFIQTPLELNTKDSPQEAWEIQAVTALPDPTFLLSSERNILYAVRENKNSQWQLKYIDKDDKIVDIPLDKSLVSSLSNKFPRDLLTSQDVLSRVSHPLGENDLEALRKAASLANNQVITQLSTNTSHSINYNNKKGIVEVDEHLTYKNIIGKSKLTKKESIYESNVTVGSTRSMKTEILVKNPKSKIDFKVEATIAINSSGTNKAASTVLEKFAKLHIEGKKFIEYALERMKAVFTSKDVKDLRSTVTDHKRPSLHG